MLNRLIRIFRPLHGAWVRVHVTGAPSVEGRYLHSRCGYLFVSTPRVLPEGGDTREQPLAGELAIPKARITYVQRMPA
jgi:hypothetical protein